MKHLNEYISEKLKINSKLNVDDHELTPKEFDILKDNILNYLLTAYEPAERILVERWLSRNKVRAVEFICSQDTCDRIKDHGFIKEKELTIYNTNKQRVKICEDELKNADSVLPHSMNCSLYESENMLASVGGLGNIYAWKI